MARSDGRNTADDEINLDQSDGLLYLKVLPSRNRLFSCSFSGSATDCDLTTGAVLRCAKIPPEAPESRMGTHFNSADVFPDASRFVGVGSYEGAHCVLIYDYDSFSLSSHQALQPLTVGDEIIFTARIKCVDDSLVAVASDGCLLVHDVAANRTITAKRGRYCSTSLLVHSSLIMCPVRGDTESSSKASIVVWKCPTLERLLEVPVGQYTPFSHCVCPSQDGFLLFTGLSRSTIFANNLDTGEKVAELKPRTSLDSGPQVYYMIQGWRVLFAASSTTITLYNIGEWNERQTLRKHDQNVNCIAIHRDRLFTGGHDKLIIVWGLY